MHLKLLLLIALMLGSMHPSSAAVKTGERCSKVGTLVKSKNATLVCIKSGKVNRWAEKKNAVSKSTQSTAQGKSEQLLIAAVPQGGLNTTFMLGKPQSRDIGETLFFESEAKVSSLEFQIAAITWISPEYHFATEDQKHNLERPYNRGQYKPFIADINVSLWKDDQGILAELPEKFDLRSGFTKIEEFNVQANVELGENVNLSFPKATIVKPGHYYLNLHFTVEDLNVTTLRFAGRQTGDNTLGGPNRDMPTSCNYNPSKDLYPRGQAYFSYQENFWDEKTPEEKWSYQTPRSYTFKLHDYAKVQDCIVIGSYNDILNTGDIYLNVYGSKP
jgi:hypothetical protein